MQIKFQGQYDKALFYRAVRLANQPHANQRRFLWFILVFALGVLILLLYRTFESGDLAGNAILLGLAAIMVVIVGGVSLTPYYSAWRLWSNPGTRRMLKGQVTNRGILYILEEGQNEIPWERINRIRRNNEIVSLVRYDGLLLIFPRRFFKRDSDWRKFNKLVDQKNSVSPEKR